MSAWLTSAEGPAGLKVSQSGIEIIQSAEAAHLQVSQADTQLHDQEFDAAWEGSSKAPVGHTVHDTTSDFDSAWGASNISASHTPEWEGWD